jgi:VWFA-related protein
MTMVRKILTVAAIILICVSTTRFWAQQKPQPDSVFRVNVNLVQVDAIVTDAKGRPVKDLQTEDFELRQDGELQEITNCSFIDVTNPTVAAVPSVPAARPKAAVVPPGPARPLRADQVRRTIALVVDDLAMSFDTSVRVRESLKRWVDDEMRPGDLAAVIRTSSGTGVLQQFTSDKRLLYAAIDLVRYHLGRVGVSSFAPLTGSATSADRTNFNDRVDEGYTIASMNAIRYVVQGLRGIPGRKSLVLFSESMRLQFREGNNIVNNPVTSRSITEDWLQKLTDAASRSSVAIYAIDPRGVAYTGFTSEDRMSEMTPEDVSAISSQRTSQMIMSQDGMVVLAQKTGGLFLQNDNDIHASLRQAVDDGDGYYLLGYRPDAATFSEKTAAAKFHSINVRVKRAGLHVRARTGFFGSPDIRAAAAPEAWQAKIGSALISPFATTAVRMRLTPLFTHSNKEGSCIDVMLLFDARDLTFTTEPDGRRTAVIDIAAATFDAGGSEVEGIGRTYRFHLAGDDYERALKRGLIYSTRMPVKKPGAYQMRAVVRDVASQRLGSACQFVEVPDVKKGRLALSGILLSEIQPKNSDVPNQPKEWVASEDPNGTAAVRIFKPAGYVTYTYQIMNASVDKNRKPQLDVQTLLYREGQQVFAGASDVISEGPQNPKLLNMGGRMRLQGLVPGYYAMQLVVTDKLAAAGRRIAAQSTDFQIRQ